MNTSPLMLALLATVLLTGCGSDSSSDNDDSGSNTETNTGNSSDNGTDNGAGNDNSDSGDDSGEDASGDNSEYQSLQVNATNSDAWQYIDLVSGTILDLTDEQAAASTEWHLALQRYNVRLNGGDSGPGNVQAALADAQDEFFDDEGAANASVFTNADADTEAAALSVAYDTSALDYQADNNEPATTDWYSYDFMTHTISADTSVGYLLRHADGESYSRVFLTSASYDGIELSYVQQAAGTVQFAEASNTLSATFADDASSDTPTRICLDLDSQAAVDCSNTGTWDWMYEVDLSARAINLWTNGGVYGEGNGAVFGPIASADLATYSSATNRNGTSLARHYSSDSSIGLFSEHSWYSYNLTGSHQLWPNFRTYLIDLDSSDDTSGQIALQISSYYSLGASGSPELRFRPLATEE